MNRGKARKRIRKLMRLHLERHYQRTMLEFEVFGGSAGHVGLTDPRQLEAIKEACQPEAVQAWVEENVGKPIAEKDDVEAFDKIVDAYCAEVIDEEEITDELCDELIAALQKHFAGTVMLGENHEPHSGDHLFVYEPNPKD